MEDLEKRYRVLEIARLVRQFQQIETEQNEKSLDLDSFLENKGISQEEIKEYKAKIEKAKELYSEWEDIRSDVNYWAALDDSDYPSPVFDRKQIGDAYAAAAEKEEEFYKRTNTSSVEFEVILHEKKGWAI